MAKRYFFHDLVHLFLNQGTSWAPKIDAYNSHLLSVLSKAFRLDLSTLQSSESEECQTIRNLLSVYQQMRTPTSSAQDATLAINKFPILIEIGDSYSKQKEIIETLVEKLMISYFEVDDTKRFSLKGLVKHGYNADLAPDYDALFDEM